MNDSFENSWVVICFGSQNRRHGITHQRPVIRPHRGDPSDRGILDARRAASIHQNKTPCSLRTARPERHARIKNATRTKYGTARGICALKRELNSVMISAIGYKNYDCIKNIILCGMSHSLILDKNLRKSQIYKIVNKNFEKDIYGNRWKKTYELISNSWWSKKILDNKNLKIKDFQVAQNETVDFINSRESYDLIYNENYRFDFEKAVKNITVPVLIIELISDIEKDIGSQSNLFKSFGEHFYTFQLKNSHTGILSDEGKRADILETKVDLLSQKIIEFNKNHKI